MFSIVFLIPVLFISVLSFLMLILGIVSHLFSSSLRYKIRLFIWDLSFFLMYEIIAINFPNRTNYFCCIPQVFVCFVSIFICLHIFLSFHFDFFSLPHWFFGSILFNLYILVKFSCFPFVIDFWFHIIVVRKKYWCNSVFLHLLSFVLWTNIWSVLEDASCVLEKNVHSDALV